MPNWKKVITSGSNAHLNHITASSYTGSFVGDGSGLTSVTSTVDIDGLGAGTSLHQTQDHFMFSDNGTEKKITFSNLEDAIFGNVSGNATIAAGGALALADNSVGNDEMADNAIGNAELKQDDDIVLQSLTTTNNISGSTIEGQTLTADVFLSSPSASLTNITTTNITASGNISASGNLIANELTLDDEINLNTNNKFIFQKTSDGAMRKVIGFDSSDVLVVGSAQNPSINLDSNIDVDGYMDISSHITASGNISASGNITASSYTGSFVGDGSGLTNVSATVADESVTLAKLAHAAANTVLVRDANSAGDPSFKAVTNTQILIGDGTGFTAAALSGDVTMTNAGVTSVADNKIGNSELKQNDDITLQSLTTTNNISGSTIEGQTLTADVFLSSPSASIVNLTNTNITSSGNISASSTSGEHVLGGKTTFGDVVTNQITQLGSNEDPYIKADGSYNITIGDPEAAQNGTQFLIDDTNQDFTFGVQGNDGFVDITMTTDASNATGDTGALRCEGGASIAKKLFVGTDLDVDGTANLDVVDIDGAVNMAAPLTITSHITSSGNISASGNAQVNQITASAFQFIGSGTAELEVEGHITASGEISASGNIFGLSGRFSQIEIDGESALNTTDSGTTGQVFADTEVTKINIGKAGAATTIVIAGNITASQNITGSTIEGQTLTADVFLSAPSASLTNITTTNITASGNISASGGITAATLDTPQIFNTGLKIGRDSTDLIDFATADNVIGFRVGDNDEMKLNTTNLQPATSNGLALGAANRQWSDLFLAEGAVINFDNGDVTITQTANDLAIAGTTGTSFVGHITASGHISASGEISTHVGQHIFSKTSTTDADFKGDVVFFGGTTSMDNGKIYHYKSDGTWELADADAVATCDGLLAVALGTASDTNGMLLRGTVTLDHDPGAVGDVLYLSTTAGQATATAPSGNTDIARVVGYCLDASNGQIWFNPSSTFVEVSA